MHCNDTDFIGLFGDGYFQTDIELKEGEVRYSVFDIPDEKFSDVLVKKINDTLKNIFPDFHSDRKNIYHIFLDLYKYALDDI